MQLFVETNFLIELVKRQEQVEACERILTAAEQKKIELYLPAFSLMEPVYKVDGERKQQNKLIETIDQEARAAIREGSETHELQQAARVFTTLMEERNLCHQNRLLEVSHRVTQIAQLIPLSREVWTQATMLYRRTSLRLPDALVAASVLAGLNEGRLGNDVFFVTRDKHFKEQSVRQLLTATGCHCLFDFEHFVRRAKLIE